MKIHYELEIRTIRDTSRDADKLRSLLKVKQEGCGEATQHRIYINRLVTEIECSNLYYIEPASRNDTSSNFNSTQIYHRV
jgi:hypothetical protein